MIDQLTTLELTGLVLSAEFALVACIVPALLWRRGRRQVATEQGDAQRLHDGALQIDLGGATAHHRTALP